jgi:hypothetical protein
VSPLSAIAALPFVERPALELLALDRDGPDPDFEGYGWAMLDGLWLTGAHGWPRRLDHVLVIAAHAADDGAALPDDVELDFAIDGALQRVSANAFLAAWLPRLPRASSIVLAMCNPHRARLPRRPGATAILWYPVGDAVAWFDPGDRIRLTAEAWRSLGDVTTELSRPVAAISDEEKQTYVGLYLLKKLDLRPEDGGLRFPVVAPSELSPLDDYLQQLAVEDRVAINRRTGCYEITKQGLAYLGEHIDEATDLIDEFDDAELADVVVELRRRNLDVLRARFLWGWYDGELDDLVLYQERRGAHPVERMWAFYLTGDELWRELWRELS